VAEVGPVLTTRELNRALLARQLLLERSSLSIPAVLEQVGGLQTQYAPSGYIGLWSRMLDFERPMLTRALEERQAVQATLMRVTIHTVSAADYWPMTEAIRRSRQEWWTRAWRRQVGDADIEAASRAVREMLADGPLRANEIVNGLTDRGFPSGVASGVGLWVDIVRVPPSGTWERRRADLYGLAETWLPRTEVSEEEGIRLLVRRYLGAFGPATLRDLASWSGVAVNTLRPVIDGLRLRRFHDEQGVELLDVRAGPLPSPHAPAPVRFLPTWDATLLVHARRTQILPEQYRSRVFDTKTPHSVPTFLVDGQVAGAWRHEAGRIELMPFGKLAASDRRALEEESERLAAFHAD